MRDKISKFLLLALTIPVMATADITQDFEAWPGDFTTTPYTDGQGWSSTNAYSWPGGSSGKLLALWGGEGNSSIKSPLMTNGIDQVIIVYKNNGSVTLNLEFSENGTSGWTTIDSVTHSSGSYETNTLNAQTIIDGYVRLIYSGTFIEELDSITITENPETMGFTNLILNPAQPLVNTPVNTSIETIPGAAVSNIKANFYYSIDGGASYTSNSLSPATAPVYTSSVPAQSQIGALVYYYFETIFDYGIVNDVKVYYPDGGSNNPSAYYNSVTNGPTRTQDWEGFGDNPFWAGGPTNIAEWIAGDSGAYVILIGGNHIAMLSTGGDNYIRTPMLTNGAGTVYYKTKGSANGSYVYNIETSTNGLTDWVTQAVVTNTEPFGVWTQKMTLLNIYDDVHVRIFEVDAGFVVALEFDDITVSYPPADALISNVTHSLGYFYITNEVTVTCDIATANNTIPAGNFKPKLCYRSNPADPWTTNNMTKGTPPSYAGIIPALENHGQVDYFIRCDFDGYAYTNAFNNESLSPAFWPDTPETEHSATSWTNYIVRPYRSDFDYLSVTSSAGNATMTLSDDNTWHGAIDMTINTQANLTFGILGFGYYTNGAPAHSLLTNHWGDTSHSNYAGIPDNGVAEVTTTPIIIGGPFASPVIISLNTKSLDYLMVRGFYQDFDSWSSANSDFYERTTYGIGTTTITNDYNDWTISTDFVTTELTGLSAYFNNWTSPTSYAGLAPATPGGYWYTKDALLLPQRGDGTYIQNALILQPTSDGEAYIFPTPATLDDVDGIGHVNFKYRVSELAEYYAVRDNEGRNWQSIAVEFGCSFTTIENDAKFSIITRHDDLTGDGYKLEVFHELGTVQHDDINYAYYVIDGGVTNEVAGGEIDNNKHLNSFDQYGFMLATNSMNYKSFWLSIKGENYYKQHLRAPGTDSVTNNNVAIEFSNCDVDIDWVKIRPVRIHTHNDETYGPIENTNMWYKHMFNSYNGDRMTNTESYIVSPFLPFDTDHVQFKCEIKEDDSAENNIRIAIWGSDDRDDANGEPSPSSGRTIITNLYLGTTDPKTLTISVSNTFNYIWFCENHTTNPTTMMIDDLIIFGSPDTEEDFTSPADTNNWTFNTKGGWNLKIGNNTLNRPNIYPGPPVRIFVETTPLEDTYLPAFTPVWTTIYTNTVTNVNWSAITTINLDALDPFVEHAHPIGFRIRNDNETPGPDSTGYLIIDDVDFSDWHGETIGDNTTWKATEARVEKDGSDVYIELARDRAYKEIPNWGITNIQYVQSPPSPGGIASVGFKFKVTNAPVSFGVFISDTNNMSDPIWDLVPYSSFTVTNNSTVWSNKTVSIRAEGPWAVRIANTSATDKATLMITKMTVSDYSGEVDSTWIGHNTLITDNQTPEYSTANDVRTCYLNKDGSSQVLGGVIAPTLAYLESPRSETGIGSVSFWYRHFDDSGDPAGTLEFYVATTRTTDINEWGDPIFTLTDITNTMYQYFSQSFYLKDFHFLKIVNGTNGVANGRVCIDNVLIKEPMGATLALANITTIPAVPLYHTPASIEVEVTKNLFSASNVTMRAYYKEGTGNWGAWSTNDADGSLLMTNASGSDNVVGVYRATDTFGPYNIDDIIQYYIVCYYDGEFNNSPQPYKDFDNPLWYEPIDLNAADPESTIPYYFTFSCTTGAVWINEYDIWNGWNNLSQFIELCGEEDAPIKDWELHILDNGTNYTCGYTITNDTLSSNPTTNGFAFWLIGASSISPKDQALTNTLIGGDIFRLVRSMGAYVQPVVQDGAHTEVQWGTIGESISLQGTGSWSSAFTDWITPTAWSPGTENPNQKLINAFAPKTYVGIEIIDAWISGSNTWVVYEIEGTNHYLPPVPLYTTNIQDPGSWSNVTSSSYTSALPYAAEWVNTYTSWWTTISAGAAYHKLSVTNIITP